MMDTVIVPAVQTGATGYAAKALRCRGLRVVNEPCDEVTHLLLPVPSRIDVQPLLAQLPDNVTVIGGNLEFPDSIDLLKDERYLAKNAMITAHIAVRLATERLKVILAGCPVLVLGWGRIGKCLTGLLQALGANVTVAARKPADRAMAEALGNQSCDLLTLKYNMRRFRVILNTIPSPVLGEEELSRCRDDCVKLELASTGGMVGDDVVIARGLPGKYAPETSGNLIADTVLRLLAERSTS